MRTIARTLFCILLLPPAAIAGSVYTWVDADGVTHFSETPPTETGLPARRIEVDTGPAIRSPVDDDYFSVINQARRMQQSRLESEQARAERLQAEAEASRARAEAQAARSQPEDGTDSGSRYYYPLYGSPGFGLRPGHRPGRPGHLPSRPGKGPSRPTVGIPTGR